MSRVVPVALLAVAAAAIGCGDTDTNSSQNAAQPADSSMRAGADDTATKRDAAVAGKGAVVRVVDSQFGRVIADKFGEAFYLFDKERSKQSECYGECAKAWPPMLTKGRPRAGSGAKQSLLGTTRRRNGKLQVTYAGHPLYYYKDDEPGKILCHDVDEFGGLWLVVKPSGKAVG